MMRKNLLIAIALLCVSSVLLGQATTNTVVVHADAGKDTISKFIYSQFAEHLGHGIYGGIWVGENSPIPNTRGIRNDVVDALKKIKVAADPMARRMFCR